VKRLKPASNLPEPDDEVEYEESEDEDRESEDEKSESGEDSEPPVPEVIDLSGQTYLEDSLVDGQLVPSVRGKVKKSCLGRPQRSADHVDRFARSVRANVATGVQ